MPLYEYRCQNCSNEFEALVRHNDTPACPACQATDLERLRSTFAVNSEGTRQSHLKTAREKQVKINRDKTIDEQKALAVIRRDPEVDNINRLSTAG